MKFGKPTSAASVARRTHSSCANSHRAAEIHRSHHSVRHSRAYGDKCISARVVKTVKVKRDPTLTIFGWRFFLVLSFGTFGLNVVRSTRTFCRVAVICFIAEKTVFFVLVFCCLFSVSFLSSFTSVVSSHFSFGVVTASLSCVVDQHRLTSAPVWILNVKEPVSIPQKRDS